MFRFLKNIFGSNGNNQSKSLAKSRLHFVLVQDRAGLTNDEMDEFKQEIIEVIERYFIIDKQGFDVSYQREQEESMLLINSPIVVRRKEGPKHQAGKKMKIPAKKTGKKAKAATEQAPAANS